MSTAETIKHMGIGDIQHIDQGGVNIRIMRYSFNAFTASLFRAVDGLQMAIQANSEHELTEWIAAQLKGA